MRPAIALVFAESRGAAATILGLALAHAAVSSLAVLLLIPLVRALAPQGSALRPAVFGWLDTLGERFELPLLLLVVALAGQAILVRLQSEQLGRLTTSVTTRLRKGLFDALVNADWASFVAMRSADVTHTLTEGTLRAGHFARLVLMAVSTGLLTLAYVTAAFALSPALTSAVLLAVALLLAALAPLRRGTADAGVQYTQASKQVYRSLADTLASMRVIRTSGREKDRADDLARTSTAAAIGTDAVVSSEARLRMWFEVAAAGLLGLTVFVAVRSLALAPETIVALLVVVIRLAPQAGALQAHVQAIRMNASSVDDIVRLEHACGTMPVASETQLPITFEREVRLDRVSFAYDSRTILDSVSLRIPARGLVALVGPSGAGKSTIADVVLGLLTPAAGRVMIDGEVLTPAHLASWRSRIAYVPQDPVLLHDTIRANLRWAAPEASEADLARALRIAAAEDLVTHLPEGMETTVGDRGARLSGGERQRIALARAVLSRPSLLILDEASSALDPEHERAIHQALDVIRTQAAVLIITHRLRTVRSADMIHVLDGGRVVEQGTWNELMGQPQGRFAAMYEAQDVESLLPSRTRSAASVGEVSHVQ